MEQRSRLAKTTYKVQVLAFRHEMFRSCTSLLLLFFVGPGHDEVDDTYNRYAQDDRGFLPVFHRSGLYRRLWAVSHLTRTSQVM